MLSVSSLHVYPIKSCAAIDLKSTRLDALGPLYDRRFMLIDQEGRALTQREAPALARIRPRLSPTALAVGASNMPALKVAMSARGAQRLTVQIWEHTGEAEDVGQEAAAWFSQVLERECRLVRFPDDAVRWVDGKYAQEPARVGFSDGFPLLLTTTASLDELNKRASPPLPMNRFRPNLVVTGGTAHEEDEWKRIRVGDIELDVVKPCSRCTTTTVDQATGRVAGKEPLATLAGYRTQDAKVLFGQNCVHRGLGSLRIGDEVEVLERR